MWGELFLPLQCAGCGRAGQRLCLQCQDALSTPPTRVFSAVNTLVPVYALGAYGGPHRRVVLAMKERNNLHIRAYIGAVVAAALEYLQARGELPFTITLVPAPTRTRSARLRGGDPVRALCEASGYLVQPLLLLDASVADQGELNAQQRKSNLVGRVLLRGGAVPKTLEGPVVVVDDVVTTGATLSASVARLMAAGVEVSAALCICAA